MELEHKIHFKIIKRFNCINPHGRKKIQNSNQYNISIKISFTKLLIYIQRIPYYRTGSVKIRQINHNNIYSHQVINKYKRQG